IVYTRELTYGFYIWNTFLAVMPVFFSRQLIGLNKFSLKAALLIVCWLAFFPNAPYIITDLFHYTEKPPVPKWFDLLLVTSAAWNGLILGIISLMQVEQFLTRLLHQLWVKVIIITSFGLCGYGIYIGRFLRFNSWDVITNPGDLMYVSAHHILQPHEHTRTWGFTLLFAIMFGIIYFTLKQLRISTINNQN
ncbi:MAG TPA: DUF1361 domain-containing protein, partial [Chitinophagaceae bacterium]|nr:DUF1361 domain-containing protein [Chitinophagaceae bacterium]